MIEAKLHGIEALTAKLSAVKFETRYRGGRFALRKAAQVWREAAKANAQRLDDPETGRSIAQNIAERWNARLYKATGDLAFRVGVMGGARSQNNPDESAGAPTPHWRFFEFGTEKMAAQPFMQPAAEQNVQSATDVFIAQYGKALDRALKKS